MQTSHLRFQRVAASSGTRGSRINGPARPPVTGWSRRCATGVSASAVGTSGIMNWENKNNERSKREENVEGGFWVDSTCINCDTCRWMAPSSFTLVNGQSAVTAQPTTKEGRVEAMRALLSCPTYSIHADDRTAEELREAQQSLPLAVPGVPGVFHCGWHTEASYGSTSYLVQLPGGRGNVLVDCPRFNPVLARRIKELGGVSTIFLTHRDDVADHEKWAAHFKAPRVIHAEETKSTYGSDHTMALSNCEVQLQGEGPWRLDGTTIAPEDEDKEDVVLVLTPGHTLGHVCMYLRPSKALFSGDHLSAPSSRASSELFIFTDFNWYSVPKQLESVAKLLAYDWTAVLPGHGRRQFLRDATHRLEAVSRLLESHGYDPAAQTGAGALGEAAAAAKYKELAQYMAKGGSSK